MYSVTIKFPRNITYTRDQQISFVKDQIVSILVFSGYVFSVTTTQLNHCQWGYAQYTNSWAWLRPRKSYLPKEGQVQWNIIQP
jgi:hypothetical protein